MNIKRWIAFLLTLVLALSFTGCSTGGEGENGIPGEQTSSADGFDAEAQAEHVFALLVAEDFDAVCAMLDESLTAQITPEALAAGWEGQTGALGAYNSVVESGSEPQDDGTLVQVLGQFEAGQLMLTAVFTEEGLITGIYIEAVNNETPDPIDLPLPDGAAELEVVLHEGEAMELGGTILLPAEAGPDTPVVVLSHGSGASDRDETVGANKPFRDIAYGLAERGIASIRFDKATYAHPELFMGNDFTVDDEYTGTVLEALRVLRAETDLGDAYLCGHSQSGMLVPYLMDKADGGFAGGLILAGTPRALWEVSRDQNLQLLDTLEEGSADYEAALDLIELETEKALKLGTMSEQELLETTVFGMNAYYLRHMEQIDAIALAIQNDLPLFIAQGGYDFQVSLEDDFAAWQDGLFDMGGKVSFFSYAELNHLFMAVETDMSNYIEVYYSSVDTVDEGFLLDMAQWIWAQQNPEQAPSYD